MSDESSETRRRRQRAGRLLTLLLWYGLPTLAAIAVAAYVIGAVVWHANPPVVPVEGVSMRPTLEPGDLVFLKGVAPARLRTGEIVAVRVPTEARSKYGLPGEIVHRIVRIQETPNGLLFVTKGDANAGNDVFTTPAADVIGRDVAAVPGFGYPFLFFRSRQGYIFLAAVAAVAVLYFVIGVFEERRAFSEGTAVAFETILAQTAELKEAVAARDVAARAPPIGPPAGAAPVVTPSGAPVRSPLDDLAEQVEDANARSRETSELMRELVGAVGEYGAHLRSHTQVMVNLAASTHQLQEATVEMRKAIVGAATTQTQPEAAADSAEPAALLQTPGEPPAAAESSAAAESADASRTSAAELPTLSELPTVAGHAVPPGPLKRAFRGYSPESVDALLAALVGRLEESERRLAVLAQHNARLDEDLVRYRRLEASLAETLKAAEAATAKLRQDAAQQARDIVAARDERAAEGQRRAAEEEADSPSFHPGSRDRRDDIGEGVYLPE